MEGWMDGWMDKSRNRYGSSNPPCRRTLSAWCSRTVIVISRLLVPSQLGLISLLHRCSTPACEIERECVCRCVLDGVCVWVSVCVGCVCCCWCVWVCVYLYCVCVCVCVGLTCVISFSPPFCFSSECVSNPSSCPSCRCVCEMCVWAYGPWH